jgi:acyl-coenzyme A synthetase/AMP-(fatty) acid ligase
VTFDDAGDLGIAAFVVTEREMSVLDLQRAAREKLPETMLPNRFEVVEELPLTPSSKLDERLLLSRAGLQPLGQPPPPRST